MEIYGKSTVNARKSEHHWQANGLAPLLTNIQKLLVEDLVRECGKLYQQKILHRNKFLY